MSGIFESLGIDSGIIIIILLILTIFLLVRNISMNMRLSRLERKYKTFMKGSDAQSLEKVFVRKFAQIDKLYDAKEEHDHDLLFTLCIPSLSLYVSIYSLTPSDPLTFLQIPFHLSYKRNEQLSASVRLFSPDNYHPCRRLEPDLEYGIRSSSASSPLQPPLYLLHILMYRYPDAP